MSGPDILGVACIFTLLVILVIGLRQWQKRRAPAPEVVRKCLHVAMGIVTLSFPWIASKTPSRISWVPKFSKKAVPAQAKDAYQQCFY